jgi:hypothetical protein
MYRVYPSADAALAVVAGPIPEHDEAMVLFSGPHAQVLAREFAEWKNSQARTRAHGSSHGSHNGSPLAVKARAPHKAPRHPARTTWKSTTSVCHAQPAPRNA